MITEYRIDQLVDRTTPAHAAASFAAYIALTHQPTSNAKTFVRGMARDPQGAKQFLIDGLAGELRHMGQDFPQYAEICRELVEAPHMARMCRIVAAFWLGDLSELKDALNECDVWRSKTAAKIADLLVGVASGSVNMIDGDDGVYITPLHLVPGSGEIN